MTTAEVSVELDLSPVLGLLGEIRDRLPLPAQAAEAALEGSELADAKRRALRAVLEALDGWIEGAKSNHEACEHRGEECWRSFSR